MNHHHGIQTTERFGVRGRSGHRHRRHRAPGVGGWADRHASPSASRAHGADGVQDAVDDDPVGM